jgi:cell division protein FtsW
MTATLDEEARRRIAEARAATRTRHPSTRRPPAPRKRPSAPRKRAPAAPPRPTTGYLLLLALVTVLCVIGLVMVLSSSSVEALRENGSAWLFFRRQLLWLAVGSTALLVASRIDYRTCRRFTLPLLLACVGLLVLVLVPGVGISVSGSSRWLGVGSWRMQPSELCKLAVLLASADLLARRADRMNDPARTLRPILLVYGVVALLVMRQPDMGTTIVLGCIVMAVMFVAGTPMRYMATLTAVAAGGAFVLGMAEPYRRARMMSFLDPWKDPDNTGYQVLQSIVGLADGGIAGVGVGAGRAKWGFLPNAHTDFIFTVVGEEMGLVGSLLVVALFVGFAVLGIRAALRAPDRFGMLVAAGITAWIAMQAFVNMGAVIGLLPVTGVPLPFVSFGGSSLVITMGAVGLLLNVARQGRAPRSS